ncbi:MAG: DUF262 domain-containing protein [Candidatus Margulisbacteria bacterium]|nr:DUF262 domain-containing protein [Candidatus Margulisiibacteriota bacterium]
MRDLPKPNTQALSWFYSESEKNTLDLRPKYQRNPIWSIGQKCFLIDSIISGCPLPQVFLNIISRGTGPKRKTIYEVVDGQQRLRSIIEFMKDEYELIETTANSYPVSEVYKPHIGKKFSQLPDNFQDIIWNYQLAVQELRSWDEKQIRALFRRLNYVVERLNHQEMRHSQYFGEFVKTVENLADLAFWDDCKIFSRRDWQRMKDIEFISELFILIIDGPQDQQKSIDKFYADYDVIFPKKKHYVNIFHKTIESLSSIPEIITNTRFNKKSDFYSLFAVVADKVAKAKDAVNLEKYSQKLQNLDAELNKDTMIDTAQKYYETVIEGANKKSKREGRITLLNSILSD